MKRAFFCLVSVIVAGRFATASGGAYSIEDGHIVRMDPWYQTATPIGNGPHGCGAIEFSEDGYLYGVNFDTDTLVKIDPTTGVSQTVGSLGIDLNGAFVDLDEDGAGQLWMLSGNGGGLYTLDRDTGAASLHCEPDSPALLGLVSFNGKLWTSTDLTDPPDPGCGLEYIIPRPAFYPHLEMGPDGWIHTLSFCAGWWYCSNFFGRFNPATGTEDLLGIYYSDSGVWGLTFDPTEQIATAIPTTGRTGVLVLCALMAVAGIVILVRLSTGRR